MTNIQAKANEMYPVGPLRTIFIEACEWLLSTLSGTPEEADEVLNSLDPAYADECPIHRSDALKAMQQYAANRVARYAAEIKKVHNAYMKIKNDEIQSLQQQIAERDKQVENWKHAAKSGGILLQNWEAENQRLTAEVEEWKKKAAMPKIYTK